MVKRKLSHAALVVLVLALTACAKAPPNLSPQGVAAWNKTRVITALDVLRDTAIQGEATVPPLISTATTRKVVQAHQSALKVMDAADTGWQADVSASLDELLVNLQPPERAVLSPYVVLTKTILAEVGR